jgi:rRNA-processing protein FCF1
MGDVLIDACGWVALIDGSFNIDLALSKIVGPPHFILIDLVLEELEEIEENRPRGKSLMLDLLLQRSTLVEHKAMHTDDALLEIANEQNIPLLTVDANLKRRSLENGIGILEIVKGKNIRLINVL